MTGRDLGQGNPPMLAARDEPSDIPANALIAGMALAAWGLAFALAVTGWARHAHHQPLAEPNGSTVPALLLFLLVWQVMTAAMMLPSSLPLMRLFNRASRGQAHPRLARLAFVAAYFTVWTGFAALALTGDALLHDLARRWLWLANRPWLIGGLALLLAGGFQLSPLKDRCLQQCRSPFGFLRRHYRRGVGAAWDMGVWHGLFCLGCCWALMLTMTVVGVGHLAWMAALTGVMTAEKSWRWGRRLTPLVGGALLIWGALVLVQPAWLPVVLKSVGAFD